MNRDEEAIHCLEASDVRAFSLMSRYAFQIEVGCDDNNCAASFCARNLTDTLGGRELKSHAVSALAEQLVSSFGSSELCLSLAQEKLPEGLKGEIERSDPLSLSPEFGFRRDRYTLANVLHKYSKTSRLILFDTLKAYGKALEAKGELLNHSFEGEIPADVNGSLLHLIRSTSENVGILKLLDRFWAHLFLRQAIDSPTVLVGRWLVSMIFTFLKDVGTVLPTYQIEFGFKEEISENSKSLPLSSFNRRTDYMSVFVGGVLRSNKVMRAASVDSADYFTLEDRRLLKSQERLTESERIDIFKRYCFKHMVSARCRARRIDTATKRIYYLDSNSFTAAQAFGLHSPSVAPSLFFNITIDRDCIISSAFDALEQALQMEDWIYRPLRVTYGSAEIGTDMGGLQSELFLEIGKELVFSGHGFFRETENSFVWFNPGYIGYDTIAYEYLGLLVGLAAYNNCVVGVNFPDLFYKALLDPTSKQITAEDIDQVDPVLAHSIRYILNTDDVLALELTFEASVQMDDGTRKSHQLPSFNKYTDGVVDRDNVQEYADELVEFRYHSCVNNAVAAFCRGFRTIIAKELLNMMTITTLRSLVEGEPHLDVEELMSVTTYKCCKKTSRSIGYFWEFVREFDESQKRQLLKFVTGSECVPAGGVSKLDFTIKSVKTDTSKLPTSQTCFATLILPRYQTAFELRKGLLMSLEHSQGFGLM